MLEEITKLHTAFEEFKKTNDAQLEALKQNRGVSELEQKLDKINADLDRLQKSVETVERKTSEAGAPRSSSGQTVSDEHRKAFEQFVRRGVDLGLKDLEVKALNITTGGDGGYAVPEVIASTIISTARDLAPMRMVANQITVSTSDYKQLVNTHGAATGWVGEDTARTASTTPSLAEVSAVMGEIYANPQATQQLLDDAFFDAEAWLAGEIAQQFAVAENTSFTTGNGTNQPKGFAAYTTAATADSSRAFGQLQHIATGSSGAYKTVSATVNPADDLVDMIQATKPEYRNGAIFMMNSSTLGTVRKWKDYVNGNYIWNPSIASGVPSVLLGYPVYENPDMASTGANALTIAFGNFKRGYTIVDRVGIRAIRDPYSNKPYVGFYITKRVGGMVVDSLAIKLIKQAAS